MTETSSIGNWMLKSEVKKYLTSNNSPKKIDIQITSTNSKKRLVFKCFAKCFDGHFGPVFKTCYEVYVIRTIKLKSLKCERRELQEKLGTRF